MSRPNTDGSAGLSPDGFVALYEARAREVLGFFARRTFDAQTAADLTAETFAAAFADRHRFDPTVGDEGAWLFGIARNLLGHYLRTRRVDRAARAKLGLPDRTLSTDDLERVEALIDFAEVGRRVHAALAMLAVDQREAVVLRVVDGLSYSDIAGRLGWSEQTVRARVSRGLRDLAIRLATDTDNPRGETR
jgi:RNA polymerase sigma factor (sigma-70 family)